MRLKGSLVLTFVVPLLVATHCPPRPSCSQAGPINSTSAEFLGSDDFKGCWLPRTSNATTGGEANYNGRLVFINLQNQLIDAVLPANLKRADPIAAASTLHPVALMFGHQTDTKWVIEGTEVEVGDDYQELILIIPFVQGGGTPFWHNYVVRMYLNDQGAKFIGNWFFGYKKADATFEETLTTFTVKTSGTPAFTTKVLSSDPWQPAATSNAINFLDVKTILSMPILGRLQSGIFVCSYFELNYANSGGEMRPIRTEQQFFKQFTSGMTDWLAQGMLPSVDNGAVELRNIEWRLAMPKPQSCPF